MPFKLKKNEVLRPFGPNSTITNDDLTDEIAEFHLAKHPHDIDKFVDNDEAKAFKKGKQENPTPEGGLAE